MQNEVKESSLRKMSYLHKGLGLAWLAEFTKDKCLPEKIQPRMGVNFCEGQNNKKKPRADFYCLTRLKKQNKNLSWWLRW